MIFPYCGDFKARNTLESRPRFTIQLASSPYDSWSEEQLTQRQQLRSKYSECSAEIEMSDVDSNELCAPTWTSKSDLSAREGRSLQTGDHLLLCLRYPKGHPVTLEMYSISVTCRATMEALSEYLKMSIDEFVLRLDERTTHVVPTLVQNNQWHFLSSKPSTSEVKSSGRLRFAWRRRFKWRSSSYLREVCLAYLRMLGYRQET